MAPKGEMEKFVNATKVMNGSLEISSTNAEDQIVLQIQTVMALRMDMEAALATMPTLGIHYVSLIVGKSKIALKPRMEWEPATVTMITSG